ncbi:MAG: dihydrofolate reductase [Betaproteobacteria bacterium]|nr:dihydrofolate reductase [Betaproteobacteria bacterium]
MAKNRVIGVRNTLPWRLAEDLRHFKALTMGHHIIMGRKTYESIGRPLPGRTTVIVTRDRHFRIEGCLSAGSINAALRVCKGDEEVFFVGGAQMYAQVLPLAHRLYLTELQEEYEGDAWFPEFDRSAWKETVRQVHVTSEGLGYHFVTYERRPGPHHS